MAQPIECLRCRTPMVPGFVADRTYGKFVQEQWNPGDAQQSFWLGLRTHPRDALPVTTMRCPTCGMLESYAHRE